MNFLEIAKKRYSVRKFDSKQVEQEKIDQILAAVQAAPTAVNYQPQRILVLSDPQELEKVQECSKYSFQAPLNFLVCYDKNVSWKRGYDGMDFGVVDASIVGTHLMLAAAELGLGTTWVGSFDPEKARKLFAIPENLIPVSFFPTGYPAESAKPSHLHESREDLEKTVFYNKF